MIKNKRAFWLDARLFLIQNQGGQKDEGEVLISDGMGSVMVVYKKPVEYHPACRVDENRFAKGDKTGYKQL
jgi:hypothetical protein